MSRGLKVTWVTVDGRMIGAPIGFSRLKYHTILKLYQTLSNQTYAKIKRERVFFLIAEPGFNLFEVFYHNFMLTTDSCKCFGQGFNMMSREQMRDWPTQRWMSGSHAPPLHEWLSEKQHENDAGRLKMTGEHCRSSDGFLRCQSFERIVAVSYSNLRASKATCRCLNWQLDARSYLDTSPVDVQLRQYTKQEGKWLLIDCRFYQMVAPKVQNTMQDSCDANRCQNLTHHSMFPGVVFGSRKAGASCGSIFPWHL